MKIGVIETKKNKAKEIMKKSYDILFIDETPFKKFKKFYQDVCSIGNC